MPKKNSFLTATDQFCGAGGSSIGAEEAGVEIKLALNHWKLAIETHNTNFQNALHHCTDISASDPRRYPSTDILITSPECTEQTNANGKKKPVKQYDLFNGEVINEKEERSRATMWDVPRFAEYHKYNYIIVENVIPARKWIMFEAWLNTMHVLGYKHKCVYHNSMFSYPVPQSRDRMYVHFWKKGNPEPNLDFNPLAFCKECSCNVNAVQTFKNPSKKYGIYGALRGQYVYRCPVHGAVVEPYYYAAFNCVDFSYLGEKIGDRKKALAANTLRRIRAGKEKNNNFPFYIQSEHSKNTQNINSLFHALPTQATRQTLGIVIPPEFVTDDVYPFMIDNGFSGECSSVFGSDTFKSFLSYYNSGSDVSHSITSPVGTFTGVDRVALTSYINDDINEWRYRILFPHECKKGMGFKDSYIVKGDNREQVMQLGNAVTPPAMKWQIERAIETFN